MDCGTLLQSELLQKALAEGCPVACCVDDGAAEALRWVGGLPWLVGELGLQAAFDIHAVDDAARAIPPGGLCIFLVATFLWDSEAAVVAACRLLRPSAVIVATSLSAAAHQCHPHATQLSPETEGEANYAEIAALLRSSLERVRLIDAQSHRREAGVDFYRPTRDNNVAVEILHLPLHCSFLLERGPEGAAAAPGAPELPPLRTFTLSNPQCARLWPLPTPVRAADAAAGGGSSGAAGDMALEDVPREERLRYRLLSHCLIDALAGQLGLDVSDAVFTLGRTARFMGPTVATVATTAAAEAAASFEDGSGGGGSHGGTRGSAGMRSGRVTAAARLQPASLVLIDRTLDLATPATRGGSLLQRMLAVLPRAGAKPNAEAGTAVGASEGATGRNAGSELTAPYLSDIGVMLPALFPGMGAPRPLMTLTQKSNGAGDSRSSGTISGDGDTAAGTGRLRDMPSAQKALASFPWPGPPSICHPNDPAAAAAVAALAFLGEEAGHAALCGELRALIDRYGRRPPPAKKRGMGAEVMALATALASEPGGARDDIGGSKSSSGALSAVQVCNRCRGVLQVALAAMEALQRTAGSSSGGGGGSGGAGRSIGDIGGGGRSGSAWPWEELAAAERLQLRVLRDGAGVAELFQQAAEALTGGAGEAALLLAARAAALAGPSLTRADLLPFQHALTKAVLAGAMPTARAPPPLAAAAAAVATAATVVAAAAASVAADGAGGSSETAEEAQLQLQWEVDDGVDGVVSTLLSVAAAAGELETPALAALGLVPFVLGGGGSCHGRSRRDASKAVAATEDEDGWSDWEEGEDEAGSEAAEAVECDTLVGRLAALLLDPARPELPELRQAAAFTAAAVGLSMLSTGLSALGLPGAAQRRRRQHPLDRPVVVFFVLGGVTCHEAREAAAVLRLWKPASTAIVVGGTAVVTADDLYDRIFM